MMQPELIVRGALVQSGRVLLVQNKKKKHLFLPGGHIEFAESASEALIREMKEELGITVCTRRFLGVIEHTWKSRGKVHAEINVIFSMSCPAIRPDNTPVSKEEKIAFKWHPLDDLTSINFQPAILSPLLAGWIARPSPERWASSYRH